MGNFLSCRTPAGIFVFLPDGRARPIESAATVAELMLEHPSHFVAELTSGKPVPLPADHVLEAKKTYVVLPMVLGKAAPGPGAMKDELSEEADGRSEILLRRQFSRKGWKPSLGTIEEWGLVKKVPHWLF